MAELPRGITARPTLVLVKLGNEILARAEDPLAALGLSPRQYLILAVLGTDAPPSQLDLAGLCGLLPAQVVPVLDELERRGLVARQRSEEDRRRSVVRLTPAGEETLAKADELARSIEDSLFGDLPADARDRLNRDAPRRADADRRGLSAAPRRILMNSTAFVEVAFALGAQDRSHLPNTERGSDADNAASTVRPAAAVVRRSAPAGPRRRRPAAARAPA